MLEYRRLGSSAGCRTGSSQGSGEHGQAPGVFDQAASVLLDPLALTVFDAEHSQDEERWFTLGMSSTGKLLALSHTYSATRCLEREGQGDLGTGGNAVGTAAVRGRAAVRLAVSGYRG